VSVTEPRIDRDGNRARGLVVAIISTTPILCEALADVFESIGEVRVFSAHSGDTGGLLRALRPDAVVIDTEELEDATGFARDSGATLLHVSLVDSTLRSWNGEGWTQIENDGWSAESIRNALIGAMYHRGGSE
jgi:hypothetical protein